MFSTTCIIDDDPIFIYSTKRVMKDVNFSEEVIVYNNGQDAIDGLKEIIAKGEKIPSIIFLDLNMPIMNGWEFLEEFVQIPNNNRKEITIYIISSSIDPRDLERIKNYKIVNNYILKPVVREDLQTILVNLKTSE
ncbi:response regulator [Pseudozobellia thermophila]|uniref:Response regulator receiver domain-containing protein n=1 Tax=Pseudozobellia thermophila TaxID=192903 RepID=A0A1M6AT30_9FLAO|nr:response regulator [Pseudozobellia thermophila]SHI39581.1 Response regulator receiver domain-containing protein [Pseudozobellia thermophila]